jgi:di/tripeptidase
MNACEVMKVRFLRYDVIRGALISGALFMLCVLLVSCVTGNEPDDITDDTVPKTPFEFFVDISNIPRCSYNEKAVSDYLVEFATKQKLEVVIQDEMFNVLIRKKGTKGRENEPPVILQAHIDIVCRKDGDYDHDFDIDPIIPIITNDGYITAQGRTTLGADNGSGVSMIMAILASTDISHPPIEALLTTLEEIGLVGADFFDVSLLSGKRLINLDSVTDEVFIVSSKWDDGSDIVIPLEPKILAKILSFPEWHYREDSPLRDRMTEVFRVFYGKDPIFSGINNRIAGVECLVFANKVPDIDMVSIGPDILGIHTPNERMNLESYNRVYNFLIKVLEAL